MCLASVSRPLVLFYALSQVERCSPRGVSKRIDGSRLHGGVHASGALRIRYSQITENEWRAKLVIILAATRISGMITPVHCVRKAWASAITALCEDAIVVATTLQGSRLKVCQANAKIAAAKARGVRRDCNQEVSALEKC